MRPPYPIPILVASALLLVGCTNLRTDKSQYAKTDKILARGDYALAITQIEAAKEVAYTHKDRVVYDLDIGMLYHWTGEYEKSNAMLELAERGIEENFTKSVSRSASSIVMNDNVLAYAGEDYEDIYLNAFKALNYLALGRSDDAFVEIRRIDNKLKLLETKYDIVARKMNQAEEAHYTFTPGQVHFYESALGRYLGMMLYRQDHKWDDVRIDLEKINQAWELQPNLYPFPEPDFSSMLKPVHPPKARLNIISFNGLAPDKKASTFYIHTEENMIVFAGSSENYLGKQNLSNFNVLPWDDVSEGYHFKIQLPEMVKRPSKVSRIEVVIEGMENKDLQTLESLENVAIETFGIQKPLIYLKTITRAVAKGLAAEQAKQKMTANMDGGMAFFTRLAADLLVDTTENADLRVSHFFPAKASICELHLYEGSYNIKINYYSTDGTLLYTDERPSFEIKADRLNLLESAYLN